MDDAGEIPFDRVKRVGDTRMILRKVFYIGWMIDRFCNYSCSYCWPSAHANVRTGLPTDILLTGLRDVKEQAKAMNYDAFCLSVLGGEATLHPGFMDLLRVYAEDSPARSMQDFVIVTNLSNGLRWWDRFVETARPLDHVTVSASWHPEQAKNREVFADKVEFLKHSGVITKATLVMDPAMFDALWQDAEYFASRGVEVQMRLMRVGGHALAPGYTPEMLSRMREGFGPSMPVIPAAQWTGRMSPRKPSPKGTSVELQGTADELWHLEHADRMSTFGFVNFQDWRCDAGRSSIVIDEKGNVGRGYTCADKRLGSLSEGFKLVDSPVCITKRCGCSADLMIPKWRGE